MNRFVSPFLNRSEKQYSAVKNEFTAMTDNKYIASPTTLSSTGRDPDSHFQSGYEKSIEWGRELLNNATCVMPAVERYVDSVIGPGFMPSPDTGDSELNRLLVEKFIEYGNNRQVFDYAKKQTYFEMQLSILTAVIRDGDCFVLPIEDGSIQMIEGHLCKNPAQEATGNAKDFLGVRTEDGIVIGYGFAPKADDPAEFYDAFDAAGIPMVWPIDFTRRPNQSRGVSRLSIVRDNAQIQSDFEINELIKQRINACICTYMQDNNQITTGMQSVSNRPASSYEIAPGAHFDIPAGKSFNIWTGNVPGDGFFQHVAQNEREICACIGTPKESAFLDPSAASFSALRQSIQEARSGYCRCQRILIDRFNRPLWNHFIRYITSIDPDVGSADEERLKLLYRCNWNPPRWPYLEPLNDAKSDTERITNGTASLSMITRERHGYNADSITKEAIDDAVYFISQCAEQAEILNGKYSDLNITWETVANIARPQSIQQTQSLSNNAENVETNENESGTTSDAQKSKTDKKEEKESK